MAWLQVQKNSLKSDWEDSPNALNQASLPAGSGLQRPVKKLLLENHIYYIGPNPDQDQGTQKS